MEEAGKALVCFSCFWTQPFDEMEAFCPSTSNSLYLIIWQCSTSLTCPPAMFAVNGPSLRVIFLNVEVTRSAACKLSFRETRKQGDV